MPSVGLAITVMLWGLARWLVRNRDSTSSVIFAEAQPTNAPSLMIGTLRMMTGNPVSGLGRGPSTISARASFAAW